VLHLQNELTPELTPEIDRTPFLISDLDLAIEANGKVLMATGTNSKDRGQASYLFDSLEIAVDYAGAFA
jgi:hypothetical protein